MQQAELLPMKDVTPKDSAKPEAPVRKKERRKIEGQIAKNSKAVAIAQPQVPAQQKNVLAIIADAASNPAVNPENMRMLLDMQKEIMAEQRRCDFNDAFLLMQSELPAIRQDRKIEIRKKDASGERTGAIQQSTPYATFPNIMKTIKPILRKYNFSLWFATEMLPEGRLLVRGFIDGYGHQRSTAFPLPADTSGSKNNQQGWGSAQSYGKRYCTIALLNIISEAGEDADLDGNEPEKASGKPAQATKVTGDGFPGDLITAAQIKTILELIADAGISEQNFCIKYGLAKTGDLPAELFDAAKKAIADHKAKASK